ncbi:MAG: BON domain-containing protein [Bacillota bacterium]
MPNRNQYRPYSGPHIDERRDWYERDMMDERSGYRSEPPSEERRLRDRDTNADQSLRGNTYESERWGIGHTSRNSSRDYSTSYSRDYNRSTPTDYVTASRQSYMGQGPKNYKRPDERIKDDICEMLTRHFDIDAQDIEVDVKDGDVTLSGTVPERRMKYLSEDVTERCFGVKDITNNIRIKKDIPASDSTTASAQQTNSGTDSIGNLKKTSH